MKDPFPIPPIPALSAAVQPWADYLGLPTLPLHIHEIVIIASFYEFVRSVVSPVLSSRIFPTQYAALSKTKKLNWDVHVVSFVQSTTINILALWVMYADEERKQMDQQERLWGYTGGAAMIQALAAGYFVWDLFLTATNVNVFGLGMLAHAISALLVYSFGFRPFVNYYSCNFILWELSSPFLNIHWFFDKLGMTGSRAQLYNGLVLIATFFSCRLVWGTYQSALIYRDLWAGIHQGPSFLAASKDGMAVFPARYTETMQFVTTSDGIPMWLAAIYVGSNLTLNSLNFYWFFKMIDAVRKRFDPKTESKQEAVESMKASGDGVAAITTGTDNKRTTRPRRRTILDGEDPDAPPPI
ncbi:putative tlc domain-containing protein [Rosellinia necatrix]|uniref:Putative tlc domain-containing protein n=1 Tax=Rosellinia necatrix TaxID=77044 RepID=A0A1W2TPK4_ROSNE|nr:putative tlc domain-containing protein [Rosellinia necatrix]